MRTRTIVTALLATAVGIAAHAQRGGEPKPTDGPVLTMASTVNTPTMPRAAFVAGE